MPTIPAPTTQYPCKYFKVRLNANTGEPLLGTMYESNSFQIKDPCSEAFLPPYQMGIPSGKVQCFREDGLRFFYKMDIRSKRILPNSMFQATAKPTLMCNSGGYTILEYKLFK